MLKFFGSILIKIRTLLSQIYLDKFKIVQNHCSMEPVPASSIEFIKINSSSEIAVLENLFFELSEKLAPVSRSDHLFVHCVSACQLCSSRLDSQR